jgi:O-antigen/teichoic acid export membrane protein
MHKLLKIGFSVLKGFSIPLMNFIIIITGIKYFGKENWGEYLNVIIWISFLVFILNWGNKDYLLRKYGKKPSEVNSFFLSNLITRSLLVPIAFVLFIFFPFQIAVLAVLIIIISHFYHSFESLVIYHQKFGQQVFIEVIGFAVFFGAIYYTKNFSLINILQFYYLSIFIKLLLIIGLFKIFKNPLHIKVSLNELLFSFPFFALGLSGMINSKIDLYLVTIFLPNQTLSAYQTITTSFLMLQALSVFITAPINKSFYRSNDKIINKLKKILKKITIPITILGSFCIWLLLEKYLKLGQSKIIYFLSFMASIPAFYYIIPVLNLYKHKKEKIVLYSNIIVAALNGILSLILLKYIGLVGIFISLCITQWIFLIIIKQNENTTSKL